MALKRLIGIAGIDVADIPVGGGLPTTWTPVGLTLRDEAKITEADPSETPFYSNEEDDPMEVVLVGGQKTIEFTLVDYDPDEMVKWLGGTATGTTDKTWNAPDIKFQGEKAIRIRDRKDGHVTFPRVKYYAKIDWNLSPSGIAKIIVKGTVLNPADATAPVVKGKVTP